ncbi:rhomboid family intramembrane serine protease [Virgibacillus dakarensis]|uniref:Rhomboid protease YdcA n=1 Tax=Lentibacillus populi TaxID=1827502 RepID=A0A9W5U115_9BACI|nr:MULTISPECIES: rhomboid family intramembrane serine protease [Bacillaceae]MBT2218316.1 rhomboid family intramembrane serine protease [Virgibacillus dakarensis]MTW85686.1 rhomboid family intramembrane serine protease [Virgibacillus dakarensis]GGB55569.1 putative rhomboid protease YdcA [Lentibacillus populi]
MFIRTEKSIKEFIQFYPVVATLVIIHLALWLIIDFLHLPIGIRFYQWGAGNNLYIHEGEYWRLLSSILLHHGFMHAIFNSFALVLFGPALEQILGKGKFILAYFVAGFAGNIATYLIDPTAFYSYVGASGAIYGLFGIYVYMIVFRKDLIDQASSQVVLIIFVIGLIMTFLRPNINIYAHIFGFIGGFAIARLLLTNNVYPFSPTRNRRRTGTVQFDPNRWNKRRRLPRGLGTKVFWIIFGILVILGLLSRIL